MYLKDYTIDDLLNDEKRYRVEKAKALNLLIRCRDLLNDLIDCPDDRKRLQTWRKLSILTNLSQSSPLKILLIWSKIINDPNYKY
jgi:hypothetical protein